MNLRLLGDHQVLNFVNTIDPREGSHRIDYLCRFRDLLDWATQAGVLNAGEARKIARQSESNPHLAARAFKRAVELREALYKIFRTVAAYRRPPSSALAQLLHAHRDAVAQTGLARIGNRFQTILPITPDSIRWRIAEDAVALLESTELNRVKRCPGGGDCGWLFLDSSKNSTRRWCSMEGCGNRAKLRRFLRRKRSRTGRSDS